MNKRKAPDTEVWENERAEKKAKVKVALEEKKGTKRARDNEVESEAPKKIKGNSKRVYI